MYVFVYIYSVCIYICECVLKYVCIFMCMYIYVYVCMYSARHEALVTTVKQEQHKRDTHRATIYDNILGNLHSRTREVERNREEQRFNEDITRRAALTSLYVNVHNADVKMEERRKKKREAEERVSKRERVRLIAIVKHNIADFTEKEMEKKEREKEERRREKEEREIQQHHS